MFWKKKKPVVSIGVECSGEISFKSKSEYTGKHIVEYIYVMKVKSDDVGREFTIRNTFNDRYWFSEKISTYKEIACLHQEDSDERKEMMENLKKDIEKEFVRLLDSEAIELLEQKYDGKAISLEFSFNIDQDKITEKSDI